MWLENSIVSQNKDDWSNACNNSGQRNTDTWNSQSKRDVKLKLKDFTTLPEKLIIIQTEMSHEYYSSSKKNRVLSALGQKNQCHLQIR